jgi:hypothetical protein
VAFLAVTGGGTNCPGAVFFLNVKLKRKHTRIIERRGERYSVFVGNFKFRPIVRFSLKPLGHFEKFSDIILIHKTS